MNLLLVLALLLTPAWAKPKAKAKAKSVGTTRQAARPAKRAPARTQPPASDDKPGKKTKVIYRTHTQIDLSGETVQGKVRAPEVFYIFQRKRSESHHVIKTPERMDAHEQATLSALRESLKGGSSR